ncbi:DMT family transporter [Streptomyces cuspidosporus]|uniref:DMT family transporter n=1 Tax=Streptomyces cuspidosporus TaxID=66882 RepID=A0ABN3GLV9_9ACTN
MTVVLSVLFVLCWASGFVGAKLGAGAAPVTTLLMWRFLLLAAVLLPVARVTRKRGGRPPGRVLGRQALIGALSQGGYLLTVYAAIQLGVNTGTTALIDGMQPLVVAALVGPLLGVSTSRRQWLGLVTGFLGVLVVTLGDASANGSVPWWAYLVPFAGMLSLVAATFIEQRSPSPVRPLTGLTVHSTTSAVVFTALALATGGGVPPADPPFWIATGWLIVLSTLGGYGLYWTLLARVGVTRVNALMFLMAPVTSVWGAVMFGEPFTPVTAVGLTVGLLAVVTVAHRRPRHRPAAGARGKRAPAGGAVRPVGRTAGGPAA